MKKFPKTIYVERREGTQDEFLMIQENYRDAAVADEKVKIAVYELKGVKTLVAQSELLD